MSFKKKPAVLKWLYKIFGLGNKSTPVDKLVSVKRVYGKKLTATQLSKLGINKKDGEI